MRRNAPCSCGSGKRFKECCGAIHEHTGTADSVPNPRLQTPRNHNEAIASLQDALKHRPEDALAHASLADALYAQGELKESLHHCRYAITRDPSLALGYVVVADIYRTLRIFSTAVANYQQALRLAPQNARAYLGLGLCSAASGQPAEAVRHYQIALQNDPRYADAYYHLGDIYQSAGDLSQARTYLTQCLQWDPDNIVAACNLAFQESLLCQWDNSSEFNALMARVVNTPQPGYAISPFAFLTTPSTSAQQLDCAKQWVAERINPVKQYYADERFDFKREPNRKRRIGYFSADIAQHATSYLMAELFELHDRNRFEIYVYSFGPNDGSKIRQRIVDAVDNFVDIRDESYIDSARRIYQDRIDILVDLKGYTKYSRPQVLALRPAPVQVSYLGYPGTMGAEFIDYILVDQFITPPHQQNHYSERFVYLPECYQINDRKRPRAVPTAARKTHGLPEKGFVFCCFNQTYKITPEAFTASMRILNQVTGQCSMASSVPSHRHGKYSSRGK